MADFGAFPPAAGPGQLRVARDLDPPALVVGEVEVQDVELVGGEQIEVAQHPVLGQEVPCDIEQHAAPGETGSVLDGLLRQDGRAPGCERRAAEGVRAEELTQRLVLPRRPRPGRRR